MVKKTMMDLESNMMRVSLYGDLVLPWRDGVKLLEMLEHVRGVISTYDNGVSGWKLSSPTCNTTVFTAEDQAKLLMSGDEK